MIKIFQVGSNIGGMERKLYPSEMQERFIVRLPAGMRDNITEVAKTNGRSMNSEIVSRLQQSFDATSLTAELAELKHLLSAQETEREVLRETAGQLNKLVAAHEKSILILQTYLVSVIDSLPKKLQSDEQIKVAKKFAQELDIDRENQPTKGGK